MTSRQAVTRRRDAAAPRRRRVPVALLVPAGARAGCSWSCRWPGCWSGRRGRRCRERLAGPGRAHRAAAVAVSAPPSPPCSASLLGVPLAWLLARVDFPGRRLVRALVTVPLVLPPVVGGVALLLVLRPARAGRRLARLRPSASRCRSPPPGSCSPRRSSRCRSWSSRSRARCAAPTAATRRPPPRSAPAGGPPSAGSPCRWSRPGIAAGAVLCWARALGEFGATITFAGNFPGRTQTMPLAVYLALETDLEAAIVLSLVLLDRLGGHPGQPARPVADQRHDPSPAARRAPRRRPGHLPARPAARRRAPARWSRCSAPTAPARPPRCARSPACCRSPPGTSRLGGRDARRPATARPFVPHRAAPDRRGVPGLPALPAPDRAGQRRLRPAPPRRRPRRAARTRAADWLDRVGLADVRRSASRGSSPAGRPSGSRWPARSPSTRRCCCSTSRWPRSTPAPGWTPAPTCAATSPTHRRRHPAGHPRPARRHGARRPAGHHRGRPGRPGGRRRHHHRPTRAPTTSPASSASTSTAASADGPHRHARRRLHPHRRRPARRRRVRRVPAVRRRPAPATGPTAAPATPGRPPSPASSATATTCGSSSTAPSPSPPTSPRAAAAAPPPRPRPAGLGRRQGHRNPRLPGLNRAYTRSAPGPAGGSVHGPSRAHPGAFRPRDPRERRQV